MRGTFSPLRRRVGLARPPLPAPLYARLYGGHGTTGVPPDTKEHNYVPIHAWRQRRDHDRLSGNPFCIRMSVPHCSLTQNAPSGEKGVGFTVLMQEKARLESLLPQGWDKDFTTFFDLSGETLMSLMAFCVACSVDGVQTREYQRTSDSRLDSLENAIGFHMRDWWQPTKTNFFADLKHTQIIDSLTEAGFKGAAADAAKMKKGDAAELAEGKMRDTRWVPTWMKGPDPEKSGSDTDNNDSAHAA